MKSVKFTKLLVLTILSLKIVACQVGGSDNAAEFREPDSQSSTSLDPKNYNHFIYVTHVQYNEPGKILAFNFEPSTGALERRGAPISTGGNEAVGTFAHPSGKWLYAISANWSGVEFPLLTRFDIASSKSSSELSNPIDLPVEIPSSPELPQVDSSGSLVTIAGPGNGSFGFYKMNASTDLHPEEIHTQKIVHLNANPHSVIFDSKLSFLYSVGWSMYPTPASDAVGGVERSISTFSYDKSNLSAIAFKGSIDLNYGDFADNPKVRFVVRHPKLPLLYILYEERSYIDIADINEVTGELALRDTHYPTALGVDSSVFPSSTAINTSVGVIDPDGKNLYVAHRFITPNGVVENFSIGNDGSLSRQSIQNVGGRPQYLKMDPWGKYLFVALSNSKKLLVFNRDQSGNIPEDANQTFDFTGADTISPYFISYVIAPKN